jgi:hypothetical protein
MEQPRPRKQKSRRLTEVSQNSIKLVEETAEDSVPPIVSSEIFEYLSKMINPETCSKRTLFHSAIKLFKVSTSSTWVELYILKKSELKSVNTQQKHRILSLDCENNLLAHSISKRSHFLLTNPHTSALYSNFPVKLEGFSVMTQQSIKLYSTAVIPLYVNYI